jgi:predicted Fe-Mo cluster-binding NifX family protein
MQPGNSGGDRAIRPNKKEKTNMITIAIPTAEGRLHGHFGGCREFTLVQADPEQRKIVSIRPVTPPPHVPGLFPRWLREQGANVIIVGGIGQRAIAIFAQEGIEVRAGEPDATVEALTLAYLNGQLVNEPAGCAHHHDAEGGHQHHHGEHHHCHE